MLQLSLVPIKRTLYHSLELVYHIIVIVDASDHHQAWCHSLSALQIWLSILRGVKDSVRLCVAGTVNAPEAAARDSDKQLLMCSECTAQDDEHRSGLCKTDGIHMPQGGQTFRSVFSGHLLTDWSLVCSRFSERPV